MFLLSLFGYYQLFVCRVEGVFIGQIMLRFSTINLPFSLILRQPVLILRVVSEVVVVSHM